MLAERVDETDSPRRVISPMAAEDVQAEDSGECVHRDSNSDARNRDSKRVSESSRLEKSDIGESLGFRRWTASTRNFFSSATVEPAMVVHMAAAMLTHVVWQSMLLNLLCMEYANLSDGGHNITADVCDRLLSVGTEDDLDRAEAIINKDAAKIQAWRSSVEFSILVPVVLLLGVWSDGGKSAEGFGARTHRRAVMLVSLFGRFIQAALLYAFHFVARNGHASLEMVDRLHVRPSTMVSLAVALPVALTGSNTSFDAAAYAHVVCRAPPGTHTFRLGVANGFWCLGTVLGLMMSGFIFKAYGFSGVFGTAAALEILAILLTLWLVKEKRNVEAESRDAKNKCCGNVMSPREVFGPLKITFRRRAGNRRLLIYLMLFCLTLSFGASCGRQSVMFLYTRHRFSWDEVNYGLYGMFLMVLEVIGSFTAMGLFIYRLKMPDAVVGAMSCISHLLSSTFYLLANTGWQMYVAPLVEMANGQVVVIPRAIITKVIEKNEQGRVNSLLGCMEALIPLMFEPLYNYIYSETLDSTFPQMFFLLSTILVIPPTAIFLWLYLKQRKQKEHLDEDEEINVRLNETSKKSPCLRKDLDDISYRRSAI